MKYGFFSLSAAEMYGSCYWRGADGQKKEVTIVYDLEEDGRKYQWPDKVCVGQVTEYVKSGKKGHSYEPVGPFHMR